MPDAELFTCCIFNITIATSLERQHDGSPVRRHRFVVHSVVPLSERPGRNRDHPQAGTQPPPFGDDRRGQRLQRLTGQSIPADAVTPMGLFIGVHSVVILNSSSIRRSI